MGKGKAVMLFPLQKGTAGLIPRMYPFIHSTPIFFTVHVLFEEILKPTTAL